MSPPPTAPQTVAVQTMLQTTMLPSNLFILSPPIVPDVVLVIVPVKTYAINGAVLQHRKALRHYSKYHFPHNKKLFY